MQCRQKIEGRIAVREDERKMERNRERERRKDEARERWK
jgi:hypothetical protein